MSDTRERVYALMGNPAFHSLRWGCDHPDCDMECPGDLTGADIAIEFHRRLGMTVEEAQAQHAMYFHLWTLANLCATANDHDHPRRRAAWAVRDFCADRMRETFADLVPPPESQ